MKLKHYINIVLIIIWLFVIFSFSAENADKSSHRSDQIIIKTVETVTKKELTPKQKEKVTEKYVVIVRKSAHFFLYFILGILVFILAKNIRGITPASFIYTIIFCMIYACSDEIHQLFVSGRAARILDVFIDTCGSILSTSILYTISKVKSIVKN